LDQSLNRIATVTIYSNKPDTTVLSVKLGVKANLVSMIGPV